MKPEQYKLFITTIEKFREEVNELKKECVKRYKHNITIKGTGSRVLICTLSVITTSDEPIDTYEKLYATLEEKGVAWNKFYPCSATDFINETTQRSYSALSISSIGYTSVLMLEGAGLFSSDISSNVSFDDLVEEL